MCISDYEWFLGVNAPKTLVAFYLLYLWADALGLLYLWRTARPLKTILLRDSNIFVVVLVAESLWYVTVLEAPLQEWLERQR